MPRWTDYREDIFRLAQELGVDSKEILYEEVPVRVLNRFVAQLTPFAPEHWSRGRSYIATQSGHEMGLHRFYEIVFNFDPARAYISSEYSDAMKTLTVAHVLGHGHIFKHSRYERDVRYLDSILTSYLSRVSEYERQYGLARVELAMDLALALAPTAMTSSSASVSARKKDPLEELASPYLEIAHLALHSPELEGSRFYQDKPYSREFHEERAREEFIFRSVDHQALQSLLRSNLPEFFSTLEPDLLPEWVRDILRMEALIYRSSHREVPIKFVHEGFSSWVHTRILPRLDIPPEWRIELALFARQSSRPFFFYWEEVPHPDYDDPFSVLRIEFNPYGLGLAMMEYLESKGVEVPEVVKRHSDYSLFYEHADDEFFFSFLPSRAPYTDTNPFPSGDNFYEVLRHAETLLRTDDDEVYLHQLYNMAKSGASWYRLFQGFVAYHAVRLNLQDPLEAFRRFVLDYLLSYSHYTHSLPKVYAVDSLDLYALPHFSSATDPLVPLAQSLMEPFLSNLGKVSGSALYNPPYTFPSEAYFLHAPAKSLFAARYERGTSALPRFHLYLHPKWVARKSFFDSFSQRALRAASEAHIIFFSDEEDHSIPLASIPRDKHFKSLKSFLSSPQVLYLISDQPIDPAYAVGVLSLLGRQTVETKSGAATDLVLVSPIYPV